jgi:hypothetical protein
MVGNSFCGGERESLGVLDRDFGGGGSAKLSFWSDAILKCIGER